MFGRFFASSSNATNTAQLETLNASTPENAAEIFGRGSRVFEILIRDTQVNLSIFGCQGEDSEEQKQVAKMMLAIAEQYNIHFGLTTGDNIYPHGARSPKDTAFEKYFYKYYRHFPFPIFVTLGNHDGNYAKLATYRVKDFSFNLKLLNPFGAYQDVVEHGLHGLTAPATGALTEQNEVIHTYVGEIESKIATLMQAQITTQQLNDAELKWVMPAQYYSYFIGKAQFIHLNSNTLVKDFLDFQDNAEIDNQIAWLLKIYKDAQEAGRKIIIAQHHSLFTCGKRVYHGDQDHYLTPIEIEKIETLLGKKRINYNEMLLNLFQLLQVEPMLLLSAHDHSLYYYNNKTDADQPYKIAQVISGGAGGKLQDRMSFAQSHHVPMFLKQPGFCHLSFDQTCPEEIFIHFHTAKHHVVLSSIDANPVRPINADSKVEALRIAVLSACEAYFDFLDAKQNEFKGKFFSNVTHTMADINKLHEMLAYFNQHAGLPTFETTLKELKNFALQITNQDSEHAFKIYLDAKIVSLFGDNIKTLSHYFDIPSFEPISAPARN